MMAKTTGIEWTDATWNPYRGCTKVSEGCRNCYMFRDQKRFGRDPTEIVRSKTTFDDPLKWKEPLRIFVCSWSDFFHEDVPDTWRDEAWEIILRTPRHTYMILTKRPNNIRDMLPIFWEKEHRYWQHVWIGVSIETEDEMWRLVALEDIVARVKFVSAEPLLGPLPHLYSFFPSIDWVIVGGESDFKNPRIPEKEWIVDIRDQCVNYGIPFFLKQLGGKKKIDGTWGGNKLDDKVYQEFPRGF